MEAFHNHISEYRVQLEKGYIQKAYKGLMEYIGQLRTHFKNKYPGYFVPSNIYYGYMDMTYFPLFPKLIKERKLKIAIVFIHEKVRFEVWLAGYNRNIQRQFSKVFKDNNWDKYHLTPPGKGVDSIIDHVLVKKPDFSNLDALTRKIETGTLGFIRDIEEFLSRHQD